MGQVYRGAGRAESEIAKAWSVGDTVVFDSFTSSSLSETVADGFMTDGGGDVMLIVHSSTGKAIHEASLLPGEVEVLFSTGKEFVVDLVTFRARFDESDPFIKEIVLRNCRFRICKSWN